jgi:hypothetical protein
MLELGCACDGGKDSLSMAAAAGGETVMAPGNLVVSAYVGCPDVTKVVTPDLKLAAEGGQLLHVDLASVPGARRLGGSALAQAFDQIGNDCPDVLPARLKAAWEAVQALVKQGLVSAGHDISDGGVATTLLEMAFAGGRETSLLHASGPALLSCCQRPNSRLQVGLHVCHSRPPPQSSVRVKTACGQLQELCVAGKQFAWAGSIESLACHYHGIAQRLLPPRSHLCA